MKSVEILIRRNVRKLQQHESETNKVTVVLEGRNGKQEYYQSVIVRGRSRDEKTGVFI